MNITSIIPGHLYAIDQVLPKELFDSINRSTWSTRPSTKLEIGRGLRYAINYNDHEDRAVNNYCFDQLQSIIEHHCRVQFTNPEQQGFQYWLDESGFRPGMHTDGDKASAVQIYLQAGSRLDLGTAFYQTRSYNSHVHTFASKPNTGYIMLNQPEPGRPELWHDMTQAVPPGVERLCLYLSLGSYQRV